MDTHIAKSAFVAEIEAGLIAGGPKKLLIGGKWIDPVSGGNFPTINPATGEVLAHIAEGGAQDIDLAVAAARKALNGPWGRSRRSSARN